MHWLRGPAQEEAAAISWGLARQADVSPGESQRRVNGRSGHWPAPMSRRQFGQTLFERKALRLRMADLQARVDLLRYALHGIAEQGRLELHGGSSQSHRRPAQ